MSVNSIFTCSIKDCLLPCIITFVVTLIILSIIHVIIYFQLVKMAKKRFGIEGFSNRSCHQIKHLFNISKPS